MHNMHSIRDSLLTDVPYIICVLHVTAITTYMCFTRDKLHIDISCMCPTRDSLHTDVPCMCSTRDRLRMKRDRLRIDSSCMCSTRDSLHTGVPCITCVLQAPQRYFMHNMCSMRDSLHTDVPCITCVQHVTGSTKTFHA